MLSRDNNLVKADREEFLLTGPRAEARKELLTRSWDLVDRLLDLNPITRISASNALEIYRN